MLIYNSLSINRDKNIYIYSGTLENIRHLCDEKNLKLETMHFYTVCFDYATVLVVPLFVSEEHCLEEVLVEFGLTQHLAA